MEVKIFHSLTIKPPSLTQSNPSAALPRHLTFSPVRRLETLKLSPIRNNANANPNETDSESSVASVEPLPPEELEVRFRRRSSRRRQKDEDARLAATKKKEKKKKTWEEMSMGEKALELYVGEKGALYWLNKLAYASIFVIIGGWILFRFVGPALNLYQLDAPPLSPESILKGSP